VARRRKASSTKKRASRGSKRGGAAPSKKAGARTRATTDHDEIRRWMESLRARPAVIEAGARGEPDIIQVHLPGSSGENVHDVSWAEFFARFDEGKLALVYHERAGRKSPAHRLVRRADVGLGGDEPAEGRRVRRRRPRVT
jgi:hypothetical protein